MAFALCVSARIILRKRPKRLMMIDMSSLSVQTSRLKVSLFAFGKDFDLPGLGFIINGPRFRVGTLLRLMSFNYQEKLQQKSLQKRISKSCTPDSSIKFIANRLKYHRKGL